MHEIRSNVSGHMKACSRLRRDQFTPACALARQAVPRPGRARTPGLRRRPQQRAGARVAKDLLQARAWPGGVQRQVGRPAAPARPAYSSCAIWGRVRSDLAALCRGGVRHNHPSRQMPSRQGRRSQARPSLHTLWFKRYAVKRAISNPVLRQAMTAAECTALCARKSATSGGSSLQLSTACLSCPASSCA
jgi:hypothetical protein